MKQATKDVKWGSGHVVRSGGIVPDDHPAVDADPDAFTTPRAASGPVESATAAPGEKRATKRPAKKAAAKKKGGS